MSGIVSPFRRRSAGRGRLAALVAATVVGFPGAMAAQQPPAPLELTFANPGARSMGLAGAFAPLADDATAAFANPAGLIQLLRPELSLELRARGTLEDDAEGRTTVDNLSGVSFLSAVMPLGRFSFAFYAHQLSSLNLDAFTTNTSSNAAAGAFQAASPASLQKLAVGRLALAAAYRISDQLSLGVGVSLFGGRLDIGPSVDETTRVESSDWGLNGGILWIPSPRFRLGAFAREGPRLAHTPDDGAGPGRGARTLALPDTHGIGVAFRSADGALTIAGEWDRVGYSSLRPGLAAIAGGDPDLRISDADELHLGAEYAFLGVNPVLAARAGLWLDPDHRACSSTPGSPYRCDGDGGEELHAAAGFGVAFRRFQLDVGVDRSQSLVAFSITGIVSF